MGTTNYLYQSAEGYHRREAVLNCKKNSPYIIEIAENVSDEAVDAQQRQPAPFTSLRNAKLPRSASCRGPPSHSSPIICFRRRFPQSLTFFVSPQFQISEKLARNPV
jgi:hypothetical protein